MPGEWWRAARWVGEVGAGPPTWVAAKPTAHDTAVLGHEWGARGSDELGWSCLGEGWDEGGWRRGGGGGALGGVGG